MSLALTGMRATHMMVGAAGATNFSPQLFQAQPTPLIGVTPPAITTQQAGPTVNIALPAIQAMNTAAVIVVDSIAAIQHPTALDQLAQEKKLADAINVNANALWRLAARFLANPEAFADQLTVSKSKTDTKRALPVRLKQHAAVNIPSQPKAKTPTEAEEANHSEPAPAKQQRMTKTEIAVALTGEAIPVKSASLKLPRLPKASVATPANELTSQATPHQVAPIIDNTTVVVTGQTVGNLVPYSPAHLDRARTVLRAAGASLAKAATSPFDRQATSHAMPHGGNRNVLASKQNHASQRSSRSQQRTISAAPAFKKSHAAGKSPAFLVGNLRVRKASKPDPAQIVRVATGTATQRRIVFARVPGTRGEYRFVGIDHQQKVRGQREGTASHALMTPAEALPRANVLSLAPRSGGLAPRSGAGSHAPAEPRELREDERARLVKSIQDQLAKGPAALNDDTIRIALNEYLFSNDAGEIQPHEWTALLRASLLYAARTVLPFSNNSIAQTAASQLFDGEGAQSRYAEWTKHFGVTELGDVAMVDTFLADDQILTMPEYFLKGIMDHLMDRAQELQGYDEDALPLPFTTELHLQWETIGFIHDPAISNDAQLIEAATSFIEEIAALDPYAAQHFLELVLLSTLIKTDSIQGVWNEEQAIALVKASIKAGLSDVVDPVGRKRGMPRRVGRLIAIAKKSINTAADADNGYRLGLEKLTNALDKAIRDGAISIDLNESEELRAN